MREWPHHGGARCGACGGCARRGRGRAAGPSGAGGAGAALRYGSGAGSAAGQGGSCPSLLHRLPIASPSPPHRLPIASPSSLHHLSITSPSPPRPLPARSGAAELLCYFSARGKCRGLRAVTFPARLALPAPGGGGGRGGSKERGGKEGCREAEKEGAVGDGAGGEQPVGDVAEDGAEPLSRSQCWPCPPAAPRSCSALAESPEPGGLCGASRTGAAPPPPAGGAGALSAGSWQQQMLSPAVLCLPV